MHTYIYIHIPCLDSGTLLTVSHSWLWQTRTEVFYHMLCHVMCWCSCHSCLSRGGITPHRMPTQRCVPHVSLRFDCCLFSGQLSWCGKLSRRKMATAVSRTNHLCFEDVLPALPTATLHDMAQTSRSSHPPSTTPWEACASTAKAVPSGNFQGTAGPHPISPVFSPRGR